MFKIEIQNISIIRSPKVETKPLYGNYLILAQDCCLVVWIFSTCIIVVRFRDLVKHGDDKHSDSLPS